MKPDDAAELFEYLSSKRAPRRRPHRLPNCAYSLSGAAYCVTLCARKHGTPFENPEVATGVLAALGYYRERGHVKIRAYCLMPDHFHSVLELCPSPHEQNQASIIELISRFKRYTTTQVAWKHGLDGELWQRDFYDHIGRSASDIENQCRYVLENPVRRGLVRDWREWRWSGEPDPYEHE